MVWELAWWDNYDFDDIEPDRGREEVNEILFGGPGTEDQHAQDLFVEAVFEKNEDAYIELVDYMWEEYGIDFEDAFDWEDFREWYESQ